MGTLWQAGLEGESLLCSPQFHELLTAASAHPELLSIREHNGTLGLPIAVDLPYAVKVDNRRPVDANEGTGIIRTRNPLQSPTVLQYQLSAAISTSSVQEFVYAVSILHRLSRLLSCVLALSLLFVL
jgi:hypothetical protein